MRIGKLVIEKSERLRVRGGAVNLKRRLPFAAVSFIFQYCFYCSYYRDFPGSPAGVAVRSAGANIEALSVCLMLSFVAGVVCCFNSTWMRLVYKRRDLKLLLLACTFLTTVLLPLTSQLWFIFAITIVGSFCAGTVMGRSLYTALFMSVNIHPSLIVVAIYSIKQVYVHAFEIVPALRTLPGYYAVGVPTLLAGLIFFFPYDGDEMERKRVLPEKKLRLSAIWAPLIFFMLAQMSFAFYEIMLFSQMPVGPLDPVLKIIPNAVALLILIIFGRKFSIRSVLFIYASVLACAVLAFLTGMGRAAAQMFTESAYKFYNFFFYWLLLSCFRMYGRNNARLKIFISIDVALGIAVRVLAQLVFHRLSASNVDAIPLFLILVGSFLLIPKVEQSIKNMDAQGEYAESRLEHDISLPDQREDILEARAALMQTLPSETTLTGDELTVLAYLIDGQDADVTAHFTDIPVSKVGKLTGSIVAKFGCKNKNELMAIMGAAQTGFEQRERMLKLLETDALTQEERDVALLLIEGETQRDISRKLHMDAADVGRHTQSLRNRIIVNSDSDKNIAAVAYKYSLTDRQVDIIRCLRKNMTTAEIAEELVVEEGTVRVHIRNILKKLPVNGRDDIAAWLDSFDTKET
jgi:DNA-binding CsgD family transcriptional regulator